MPGQSNGSTATGSLGSHVPGSSDDKENSRLDTFSDPEDEQARSAVLLRFPCEQYHIGITNWIDNLWENQTFQSIISPSEFIAKQVPCRPDSFSKQEPNVRTLWPDVKMMVSPVKLTDFSAAPKQLSRFANPNKSKTGRSESNLRLCGECWPNSSEFSSLMEMTKVHLLSQRSTPAHKFSASWIEETALENLCSNLPLLEVDSCLLLLHLTCVFLVFLVKCCNGHLSSQHGQCVMAALSPHRFIVAWRVEAPFSAVSRIDGFYTLRSL